MEDRLMTYAEMAEALKIKPSSAKKLAQRKKWVRIVGNDGMARVKVPVSRVVTGHVPSDVSLPDVPPMSHPSDAVIEALKGQVDALRGQVDALKGQADAERRRADAAEARLERFELERHAESVSLKRSLWARMFGR